MQGAAYPAYPYNTRTPYPAHYYPPQTFPNVYPNGGGREPTNIYADWPQVPNAAQNSMPRPREERAQRQSNGPGNTPMPRPKQLASRYRPQLKSAMKRPARSVSDPSDQLQRTRTNSDPRRTLNPMTRTRTSSNAAKDIPGLFILKYSNTLFISHTSFFQIICLCHYMGEVIFKYKMSICISSMNYDNRY